MSNSRLIIGGALAVLAIRCVIMSSHRIETGADLMLFVMAVFNGSLAAWLLLGRDGR